MAMRMIARGRHISSVALLWAAAAFLSVADVLAVRARDSGASGPRTAALAVAMVGGFLLGTAVLRGIGSLVAHIRIRQAMDAHRDLVSRQLHAEAERGIEQIEAFLAEQHSRGA
ncbi:MAG: hypothetical protein JWM93_3635 [Frankiales bacterium]|nr:hypothetical protein [Frankiales bacterium]